MEQTEGTLGQNIRRIREAAGLSQAQVAEGMAQRGMEGFYPQTVLKVEKGTRALKFDEGIMLARVLGVDPHGLLVPMDRVGIRALEANADTLTVVHEAATAMEKFGRHQRKAAELVREALEAGVELLDDDAFGAIRDRKEPRSTAYYVTLLDRVSSDDIWYERLVDVARDARDGVVNDGLDQETP